MENEGTTVRISKRVLSRIEKLLQDEDEKTRFVNKKHFVDIAVIDLLETQEKRQKERQDK